MQNLFFYILPCFNDLIVVSGSFVIYAICELIKSLYRLVYRL